MVHHTRNRKRVVDATLVIGDIVITPETHTRYLGVILDQELRWHQHVDQAVAKGTAAALAIGRLASGRFGLPYRYIRTLYISVVKPKLEYGLSLWYTPVQTIPGATRRRGSVGFANRLSRVQRVATRLITGGFKTTATDALEYHANLMPMDLQLNVAAFNAALRLASLPSHHPLASHVVKCQSRAPRYFKSPLHKLFLAFPGLLDVETIDSTPRMTTWTAPLTVDIASSREDAMRRVAELENSGTFVVFSDGSGEDNNVGAAAVATNVDGEVRVQRAYLGTLDEHTVFEAELFGVVLALRIVEETRDALDVAVLTGVRPARTRGRSVSAVCE